MRNISAMWDAGFINHGLSWPSALSSVKSIPNGTLYEKNLEINFLTSRMLWSDNKSNLTAEKNKLE